MSPGRLIQQNDYHFDYKQRNYYCSIEMILVLEFAKPKTFSFKMKIVQMNKNERESSYENSPEHRFIQQQQKKCHSIELNFMFTKCILLAFHSYSLLANSLKNKN